MQTCWKTQPAKKTITNKKSSYFQCNNCRCNTIFCMLYVPTSDTFWICMLGENIAYQWQSCCLNFHQKTKKKITMKNAGRKILWLDVDTNDFGHAIVGFSFFLFNLKTFEIAKSEWQHFCSNSLFFSLSNTATMRTIQWLIECRKIRSLHVYYGNGRLFYDFVQHFVFLRIIRFVFLHSKRNQIFHENGLTNCMESIDSRKFNIFVIESGFDLTFNNNKNPTISI